MSDPTYTTPDGRIGITVTPDQPLPTPDDDNPLGRLIAEQGTTGIQALDRLLGLGDKPRVQLWPERLIRSGATLAGDMMTGRVAYVPGLRREDVTDIPAPSGPTADSTMLGRILNLPPVAAQPNDPVIERAQDMSGLMLGGGLATGPAEKAALSSAGRPAALSATERAPVFYSGVERAIEAAPQAKMTPEQWVGYLRNQPGVKAEELQWMGLDDPKAWPGEPGKIMTKDQLLEHAGGHGVKIKEVEKSGQALNMDAIGERALQIMEEDFPALTSEDAEYYGHYDDALVLAEDKLRKEGSSPKFDQYQLPGGDNYRELLLTLPHDENSITARAVEIQRERYSHDIPFENLEREGQRHYLELARNERPSYISSHWDEPNVLVHMRMNDRSLPLDFTPEQQAALRAHDEVGHAIDNIRERQHAAIKEIQEAAAPIRRANDDAAMDELRAGKITPLEARRRMEELDVKPIPELAPLRDKLAALRTEEDALHASLPPKPEQPSLKSLHLEEVQSDWHQQGRKQGYKDPKINNQAVIDAEKIANVAWQKATHQYARDMGWDVPSASNVLASSMSVPGTPAFVKLTPETQALVVDWNNKWKAYQDASEALNKQGGTVPDAPFKQSWPDLALKRAIAKAAREGYDAVSWTPGEQQAARYDLSKHIKTLDVGRLEEGHLKGNWTLKAYDHNGRVVMDDAVPKDKLADYVGKDMAKRIEENGADRYEGLDLKVGGEGMKRFYDKMLVDKANAIAKKYGGKVEWKELPQSGRDDGAKWAMHATSNGRQRQYEVVRDGVSMGKFDTPMDAHRFMGDYKSSIRVPVLRLTPAMREAAIGRGFSLFARGLPFTFTPVDHNPFEQNSTDDALGAYFGDREQAP